jgi:hypothetical protein
MVRRHVFDSCFPGVMDMLPVDLLAGSNTRHPSRLRRKRYDLGVLRGTVEDDEICDPLTSIKGSDRRGVAPCLAPYTGHIRSKKSTYLSGRRDLNPRPLDPQNGGVGLLAGHRHSDCRTRRGATCGLFGCAHGVWSPDGPQGPGREWASQSRCSDSAIFRARASRSCATMMWSAVGLGCSIAVQTDPVRSMRQR